MDGGTVTDKLWCREEDLTEGEQARARRTIRDRSEVMPSCCWEWRRARKFGYGSVQFQGRKWQAHRLSYAASRGPIPAGMRVLHTCHNPACCNPRHLKLGTARENTLDMCLAGRQGGAKLSPELARQVKNATGLHRDIAAAFGISRSSVSHIKAGRQHKYA